MKHLYRIILLIFLFYIPSSQAISTTNKNNFLVLSDLHLNATTLHTMEISPSEYNYDNDLDQSTFLYFLTTISENSKLGILKNPKFIIVLGDIVQHDRIDNDTIINSESVVFHLLKQIFPNTPIFYTFGNNDSLEVDYGPFKSNQQVPISSPYDVAKINGWNDGFLSTGIHCGDEKIFPCLISENIDEGYYSAYIEDGFRLISLNSVEFSHKRQITAHQQATQQLDWLEIQLKAATKNHEAVIVTMHIPPGNNIYNHSVFWKESAKESFLKLVKTYKNTIVGILAAHTHASEIKVIVDHKEKPIAGIYLNPGLSTSHGNEPAITSIYYNKKYEHWQLQNFKQYHFLQDKDSITLDELYNYNHYYCQHKKDHLLKCLTHITPKKIKKYYTAGNKNYSGVIRSSQDYILNAS